MPKLPSMFKRKKKPSTTGLEEAFASATQQSTKDIIKLLSENITNGSDQSQIEQLLVEKFNKYGDPNRLTGEAESYYQLQSNIITKSSGLKELIRRGEVKPMLPKGMVGDKGEPISTNEYYQIYREITMLALINQTPFVSLNSTPESSNTIIDVIMPPVLKDTLVGYVLTEADYMMKSMLHYPISYISPKNRENALSKWKAYMVADPGCTKPWQGEENVETMKESFKYMNAILFADDKSIGKDLQQCAKESYKKLEYYLFNDPLKSKNPDLSYVINPSSSNKLLYDRNGNVMSTCCYEVSSKVSYDSSDGKRTIKNTENCKAAREVEHAFRHNMFPPARKIMAMMDLIYKLYPISRAMVEEGHVPSFRHAPDYKAVKTFDELPPILNIQFNPHVNDFVTAAYGGVNYCGNGMPGEQQIITPDPVNSLSRQGHDHTPPAPPTKIIGYHATSKEGYDGIMQKGFREPTAAGRLGKGVYLSDDKKTAADEYFHRNKKADEAKVMEVKYRPGVNATTDVAPRKEYDTDSDSDREHTRTDFPFGADSVTAPSVRGRGRNTMVRNRRRVEGTGNWDIYKRDSSRGDGNDRS